MPIFALTLPARLYRMGIRNWRKKDYAFLKKLGLKYLNQETVAKLYEGLFEVWVNSARR